jgi:hypothetical protein
VLSLFDLQVAVGEVPEMLIGELQGLIEADPAGDVDMVQMPVRR